MASSVADDSMADDSMADDSMADDAVAAGGSDAEPLLLPASAAPHAVSGRASAAVAAASALRERSRVTAISCRRAAGEATVCVSVQPRTHPGRPRRAGDGAEGTQVTRTWME
jgi:hypothetical protein